MEQKYCYNGLYGYPPEAKIEYIAKNEKIGLKFLSRLSGLCVLAYVVLSAVFVNVLAVLGVYDNYLADSTFQSAANILYSLFTLLLPFAAAGLIVRKKQGVDPFVFQKPEKTSWALLAVPVGFAVCLAGNFVTNAILVFLEEYGITLVEYEELIPTDFFGRLVYCVQVAVVPAFVEELAFRGVVMQPLRKYGESFAVFASAAVFAIMHGNLAQVPFAFIAGVAIGYAVSLTGSLWTGIAIHFANNLYSVVLTFLIEDIADGVLLNTVYWLINIATFAVGAVAALVLYFKARNHRVPAPQCVLITKDKTKVFALTLPMIVAAATLIYYTTESFTIN